MDALLSMLRALPRTLTYNDFAYANLIAARDGSFAYDYNLPGKSHAYADVRNVCAALSPAAQQAFCQAYGPADPAEQTVNAVAGTPVTFIAAPAGGPPSPPGCAPLCRICATTLQKSCAACPDSFPPPTALSGKLFCIQFSPKAGHPVRGFRRRPDVV